MNRSLMIGLAVFATAASTLSAAELKSNIYGYLEGYVEKVESSPARENGTSTAEGNAYRKKNPYEFNTPHINVMMKSVYKEKYSGYLNLTGEDGAGVSVQNAWVETKIKDDLLKFRLGKMYRPFGLYNEQLDAVPTYMGIEPPELFDGDHLLLTRTTNMMIHGEKGFGSNILRYAVTTGNDEHFENAVPFGGDLRFAHYASNFDITVGSSFYVSNKAAPSKSVGSGSPDGGVLNWMESDSYNVLGFYTEFNMKGLKLQGAYYNADHDAKRKGSKLQSLNTAQLTNQQISRLCGGNCATATDSFVSYDVKTWYVRAGYSFMTEMGELLPYLQWDYYSNPETVAQKSNGGDNEAGVADDGKFTKQTIGMVYRPYPVVAFKLDASNHSQKVEGKDVNYGELRFSYSYIWTL